MIGKIHSTISSMNWKRPNNPHATSTTPKNAIRVGRDQKMVRGRDYRINDDVLWCVVAPKACDCKGPDECNAQTIVRVDTTVVTNERRVVDTLVVRDTITRHINRDGAVVKIKRIHDTIRVDVICPSDTIRITTEIPVDRLIYKEQPVKRSLLDQLGVILFLILLITIALIIGRFIRQ